MPKEEIKNEIAAIENRMNQPDFWSDKTKAQADIKRLQELKDELEGLGKYDKQNAILTVFAGAGGDDAEDFTGMLYRMYVKYLENQGWGAAKLHEHANDHGGYRNITIEVVGKGSYGKLKTESGVHRLVRISPFNANQKRHTSFAMVEVTPKFDDIKDFDIPEDELKIEFSRSSGPGGQNVNKRETAVRIVHLPSGLSAQSDAERTQERNRDIALGLLKGKIYKKLEEEREAEAAGMHVSKTTDNEWGSQIRSYVLHPYKMVKDHRTGTEVNQVEKVLEDGEIQVFIDAMKENKN